VLSSNEIISFLQTILQTPIPKFGENFVFPGIFRTKIPYELPSKDLAEYERARWGAALTFSNLVLDDFFFILMCILLEKKVVFTSTDIALLTATM